MLSGSLKTAGLKEKGQRLFSPATWLGRSEKFNMYEFLRQKCGLSREYLDKAEDLSIEQLSGMARMSAHDLGTELGNLLGVPYLDVLKVPRVSVVSSNKEELLRMKSQGALIQCNAASKGLGSDTGNDKDATLEWFLVTSDPRRIKSDTFNNSSIKPALSTSSEIRRIWNNISRLRQVVHGCEDGSIPPEPWKAALLLAIFDARAIGAREIFFGMPEEDAYEFIVSGKRYGGSVDKDVLSRGIQQVRLCKGEALAHEVDPEGIARFYVSDYRGRDVLVCTLDEKSRTSYEKVTAPWVSVDPPPTVEPLKIKPPVVLESLKRDITKKHLLLIDDDTQFAELLRRGMVAKGFSVSIASSVNDALLLHLESDTDIDLVITDLHMPQAKGTDLIEMVRVKRRNLPIIVLTSDEEVRSHVEVLQCGADAVVSKGEDPRILFAWIFRLLAKRDG